MFLPYSFFFFIDTATTEIYTLSLHDALPISKECNGFAESVGMVGQDGGRTDRGCPGAESSRCAGFADRKSTRLNSSHTVISYAVFCLKKKKMLHITASNKAESQSS